jgi:hypothetical protein
VGGGTGPPNVQESRFSFGRRHPGQGPDLRVGEFPAGQRLGQDGEGAEGAGHAHAFPRGAEVEPHAPAEPVGTGAEAGVPAAAGVELADEIEEAGGGGLEVRGQVGDLVAQPVELRDGLGVARVTDE